MKGGWDTSGHGTGGGKKSFGKAKPWRELILNSTLLAACAGRPPGDIGVSNGRLAPCHDRPNCVSSISGDALHFVEPFTYSSEKGIAKAALERVIASQEGATVVVQTDDYCHVEFKSPLFGFVDDVEFYFPDEPGVIHVRSAARLGYSDFGVNRKRVNHLRFLFALALAGN